MAHDRSRSSTDWAEQSVIRPLPAKAQNPTEMDRVITSSIRGRRNGQCGCCMATPTGDRVGERLGQTWLRQRHYHSHSSLKTRWLSEHSMHRESPLSIVVTVTIRLSEREIARWNLRPAKSKSGSMSKRDLERFQEAKRVEKQGVERDRGRETE